MAVELGNRILFVRGGRALEGRVFAVREGACSVEGPGSRAYYLEHWEVLLVLGFDEEYARWLLEPYEDDVRA
ncbi:MAG: hypothetical protein HYX51_07885 [Chloroflexi bacterium]|nr:hypothetical protein [Chloroflexota bacterium]